MKKITLLLFMIFATSQLIIAQNEIPDNKGKEFWVMFTRNLAASPNLDLFITGDQPTQGMVEIPGMPTQNFTVTPGNITTIDVPASLMITTADGVQNKGIRITAENEVTVYGLNQFSATTDAYLALPVDILGTEYFIMSYQNRSFGLESSLGVLATEDNTEVTITPATNAGSRTAGVPFTITLNQGQAYALQASGNTTGDLTGSTVSSNKPVAVYGGHVCADVPLTQRACDHLVEQMPPATSYGQRFVTVPLATRTGGDLFRVLAANDGTQVSVEGSGGFSTSFTLDKGEFEELDIPSNVYTEINVMNNSGSILVAQFSKGTTTDGVTSDPFMMLIPPFEQFQDSYTVTTPATIFNINFINIAVPTSAIGNITLDGNPVPAGEFTQIGASAFSGAQLPVEIGTHNLGSNGLGLRFGAFMYGFANADSYGYPGGQAFGDIVGIESLTLNVQPTIQQGEEYCFTATVLKEDGTPSVGATVDFLISGANSVTGNATTDSNGVAEFCYMPENSGTDTIEASIGGLSDEVDVEVTEADSEEPVPSSLSLNPGTATVTVGEEICIVGTVLDQFGDPLPGVEVFTEQDGVPVGSGITDENGEVEYCFTPTESGLVEVVCFYEDGDPVTAEITVQMEDSIPNTLVLDPDMATVTVGEEICIVGTVLDQFGEPLAGVEVFTEQDGVPVGSGITDENGEVEYCFTPTESGVVEVVCFFEDGDPVTAEITVIEPGDSDLTVTLIDSDTDVDLWDIMDGDIYMTDDLPAMLAIRANPNGMDVGSMVFKLEGFFSHNQTESVEHYALFGNLGNNYNGRVFPPGDYKLTVTPYSESKGRGTAGDPLVVNFSIVLSDVPDDIAVLNFDLYDGLTDTFIMELVDGSIIDLGTMDRNYFSILAGTMPDFVGSVKFELNGPWSYTQIENNKPYTSFGNNNANFFGRELPVGSYTLKATPYTEMGAMGTAGTALEIEFEVIGMPLEAQMVVYPTSFSDEFQVRDRTGKNTPTIKFFDTTGQLIAVESSRQFDKTNVVVPSNLQAGIYVVQVYVDGRLIKTEKVQKSR